MAMRGIYNQSASLIAALICVFTGSILSAQAVGKKDLTQESSPAATALSQPRDYCVPSGGVTDGVEMDRDNPALSLTISKAELALADGKPSIELVLVLKNHGIGPALIPWETAPVAPVQIAENGNEKEIGYEVATVDFFLGPPHRSDNMLRLRSPVALWSQPQNPSQSIKLLAGQWVELHVRAEIMCMGGDATQCLSKLRGSKLQVSGWWYERLLTDTYKGACIYMSGAYTKRELESGVVAVSGTPYQSSQALVIDSAPARP